jgi:hypothetical protein
MVSREMNFKEIALVSTNFIHPAQMGISVRSCEHVDEHCLFVFLALQPIVVVFSQPGSGL